MLLTLLRFKLKHMASISRAIPRAPRENAVDCEPRISDQQTSPVCYAHACANAIMETEKRIFLVERRQNIHDLYHKL